jgi:hypothetical protein
MMHKFFLKKKQAEALLIHIRMKHVRLTPNYHVFVPPSYCGALVTKLSLYGTKKVFL